MSNKSLFSFAGWSAILSIVFSCMMYAVVGSGRGAVFQTVAIIAYFFTIAVFYGIYVFHRPQAAIMSLVMLACGVIGIILEGIGTGPGTTLAMIANMLYGVTFLLIGYLGYGDAQMPRWIAICAYVVGVLGFASAVLIAVGQASLSEILGLVLFVAWIAWSIGIWRLFLKTAKTAPAMA